MPTNPQLVYFLFILFSVEGGNPLKVCGKNQVLVIEEVETKEQTCQVQERVILEMTVAFFYTPVECYMHLCMIHV